MFKKSKIKIIMNKVYLLIIFLLLTTSLEAQWTNTGNNYTSGKLSIGNDNVWAPITINSISGTNLNEGIAIALDGTDFPDIGYRFKANGANYYQVLYNGNYIQWKHYSNNDYIPRMSLTNDGNLGIGKIPSVSLDVVGKPLTYLGWASSTAIYLRGKEGHLGKNWTSIRFDGTDSDAIIRLAEAEQNRGLQLGVNNNKGENLIMGLAINGNGNVGVGTINPDAKLTVKGDIHAQEVKVNLNGAVAPDYVFNDSYNLPSFDQVERFIMKHNHLPDIPSASEMEENGFELKDMNLKLLKKIEELTLYILQLKNENEEQDKVIKELISRIEKIN